MDKKEFTFTWRNFKDLKPKEMYQMLKLRQAVFIVEQKHPHYDMDGVDDICEHLFIRNEKIDDCIGTLRIVPPGKNNASGSSPEGDVDGPAIGRVAVLGHYQGSGIGRALMEEGIKKCQELYPGRPIHLGSQRYLRKFYESFGFEAQKRDYQEDGVPCLFMVKK